MKLRGPIKYTAGDQVFANDVIALLAQNEHQLSVIGELREALTSVRKAIAYLDATALGGHEANNPEEESYYFRDELLAQIDKALSHPIIGDKS